MFRGTWMSVSTCLCSEVSGYLWICLWLGVPVCLCLYACVSTYLCFGVPACLCLYAYLWECVDVCVYTYGCECLCVCVSMPMSGSACVSVSLCLCLGVPVCQCLYAHVWECLCVCACKSLRSTENPTGRKKSSSTFFPSKRGGNFYLARYYLFGILLAQEKWEGRGNRMFEGGRERTGERGETTSKRGEKNCKTMRGNTRESPANGYVATETEQKIHKWQCKRKGFFIL